MRKRALCEHYGATSSHPTLFNAHFHRVSCQSRLWDVKSDHKAKSKTAQIFTGIYLKADENPENLQLGERLKTVLLVIVSNEIPFLQTKMVVHHRERRKEGKKGGKKRRRELLSIESWTPSLT